MININSLGFLGQIYFSLKNNFKKIYQNSNFYEKKISKTFDDNLQYKPSPHLLSSIIKYQNKKSAKDNFISFTISGFILDFSHNSLAVANPIP